jgi:hypothetical protein
MQSGLSKSNVMPSKYISILTVGSVITIYMTSSVEASLRSLLTPILRRSVKIWVILVVRSHL